MNANRAAGIRSLLASALLLLAVIGASAQPAGAQGCVPNVHTVAQLQAAAAGGGNICISAGTYDLSSPLELDTPLGTTLTVQSAGDGPVILHSTTRDDIIQTGFNASSLNPPGTFVIKGLTFSGAGIAIDDFATFIRVEDCTFVDNRLGFYTDRDDAEIELVNDTFTQNGRGIALDSHKSFTGTNLTIVDNQGTGFDSGGGPQFIKDEITNSILAEL